MKHEVFESAELSVDEGDTADLRRCLWMTNMKGSIRNATLASLASFCAAAGDDAELPVGRLRQLIVSPSTELKAAVGERWVQVASDLHRALRSWEDRPTRWLALSLRTHIPTLADAVTAASLRLGPTKQSVPVQRSRLWRHRKTGASTTSRQPPAQSSHFCGPRHQRHSASRQ